MASLLRAPAPLSTPISDTDQRTKRLTGYLPAPWTDYFNGLDAQLGQSFAAVDHVQIPSGSASIGLTPVTTRILSAGIYRVTYYFVVLQVDNIGSSAHVGVWWTDRGLARNLFGAYINTNLVTSAQTNTFLLRIDRATPILYTVDYITSGGAPKMIYGLDVMLEQVLNLP